MSTEPFDNRLARTDMVNFERSVCLCDVGGSGYTATVCVSPDGDETLWLVDNDEPLDGTGRCGDRQQAHEQLGPLPFGWKARIGAAASRCGRPRADGKPCRQRVTPPGSPCAFHVGGRHA